MAFQTLNRLKWKGHLPEAEVLIIHRGAPSDTLTIQGSQITEVRKSYFYYKSAKGETYIPLHRILEIRHEGKVVWSRR